VLAAAAPWGAALSAASTKAVKNACFFLDGFVCVVILDLPDLI
jgi:hypothetical protein